MTSPVSIIRNNKGPLVATALPAPSGGIIRAGARGSTEGVTIPPFSGASSFTWTEDYAVGCAFGNGLVCDYAGAWDVHVMFSIFQVAGATPGSSAGPYVVIEIDTYAAGGGSSDSTYNIIEPVEFYGSGEQIHSSPSMPFIVPDVGGSIRPSFINNTNDDIYVEIQMSAHFIGALTNRFCSVELIGNLTGASSAFIALSPDGTKIYSTGFSPGLEVREYTYPGLAFLGIVGTEPLNIDTIAVDPAGNVAWTAVRGLGPSFWYIGSTNGDIFGPHTLRLEICTRLDDPTRMTVFECDGTTFEVITVWNMEIATGSYTVEGSFEVSYDDVKPVCTSDGATWAAFRNRDFEYVVGRWHPDTGMVEVPGIGFPDPEVSGATNLHYFHLVAVGDSVLVHLDNGLGYRINPDLTLSPAPCFDTLDGADFDIYGSTSNGAISIVVPGAFPPAVWEVTG